MSNSLVKLSVAVALLGGCAGIQNRYHFVESGESFGKIATLYGVPLHSLKEYNSDALRAGLRSGSKLYIPFEESPSWDLQPARSLGSVASESLALHAIPSVVAFNWPVTGYVSSSFGWRHNKHHEGIDIPARRGTPVRSARSGHVIYAGNGISGYGKLVIVRHADTFSTVYAHLSEIGVQKGQFVTRGQRVGRVGATGHANGPHLHFEIRDNRVAVDPLLFLPGQYARN